MTTDTNQASEDELREAVKDGLANHTGEFVNPWILRKNYSHEELTDMLDDIMAGERLFKNLQALIRTEKLKLLDRLDKQIEYNKHDMGEMGEFIRTIYAHNAIEAERTKLEAEL